MKQLMKHETDKVSKVVYYVKLKLNWEERGDTWSLFLLLLLKYLP